MSRVMTTSAGDRLEVGVSGRFNGESRTVRATVGNVDLQPDEARHLAVTLIERAAEAERRQGGRRP